jgi:hypothetical protein
MGLDKTSFLLIKHFLLPQSVNKPKILIAGRPKIFFSESIAKYILPQIGCHPLPFYGEPLIASLFSIDNSSIHILDRSDFEGASITMDLSQPPTFSPASPKYDIVLDLGTSEHVASPVNSIFNLLSFVKPGGLYLCVSPHTNNPDHGLVTFSRSFFESLDLLPELCLLNHFVYEECLSNKPAFTIWDCDTDQFRSHLPGLDGSCFSNVLGYLNVITNHFVLYKLLDELTNVSNSLESVCQLVYLRRYSNKNLLKSIPEKYRVSPSFPYSSYLILLHKVNRLLFSFVVYFFYMSSVRVNVRGK